jgi:DNA gyrase/topoisomerase IV subunit A
MSFSDKIDEWIQEAETRPASALMILKLVADRLRDLTERNEQLLAENIALQDGSHVQETRKRIAHLEYQLELLKRRLGPDADTLLQDIPSETAAPALLVYNAQGRILRLDLDPARADLGRLSGDLHIDGELPRLLCLPAHEEVLLLFTSGRVSTRTVAELSALPLGADWSWEQAALPDEPHAGERLACLMPLSRLALADFFIQASRRGCVKKTLASMAQSVLDNHYLGRGTINKADQAFDALLCNKKDRFVLVTYEGRLLGLDVDGLSYAAEERLRLEATDYVVASCLPGQDEFLLCLTQNGKVIQRELANLELARSTTGRGQALIPPSRLDQGTRFVGAACLHNADQIVVLDAGGRLSLVQAAVAAGAGSIPAEGVVLSFGVVPSDDGRPARP